MLAQLTVFPLSVDQLKKVATACLRDIHAKLSSIPLPNPESMVQQRLPL
jgi:hypothetical protein